MKSLKAIFSHFELISNWNKIFNTTLNRKLFKTHLKHALKSFL